MKFTPAYTVFSSFQSFAGSKAVVAFTFLVHLTSAMSQNVYMSSSISVVRVRLCLSIKVMLDPMGMSFPSPNSVWC